MTDPKTLDEIVSKVQQIEGIDWETHFIRTNNFQYSKIADSLASLGDLIKILLVCVSVVSAAILTLIITLRIRGRIPEAGILLGQAHRIKKRCIGEPICYALNTLRLRFLKFGGIFLLAGSSFYLHIPYRGWADNL